MHEPEGTHGETERLDECRRKRASKTEIMHILYFMHNQAQKDKGAGGGQDED